MATTNNKDSQCGYANDVDEDGHHVNCKNQMHFIMQNGKRVWYAFCKKHLEKGLEQQRALNDITDEYNEQTKAMSRSGEIGDTRGLGKHVTMLP